MAAGELTVEGVKVSFDADDALHKDLLPVAEIYTHPRYGASSSNPYDVGALILADPVEGIELAPLPHERFLDDLKAQDV